MPETIKLPGLILVAPHAQLVAEGKKTVFVKSESLKKYVGEEVFVVEGGKAWARIAFSSPKKITIKQFESMRRRHQISDEERKRWWKGKRNLYYYSIHLLESYIPPLDAEYPDGPQVFAKEASVVMKEETASEPSDTEYRDIRVIDRGRAEEVTHPDAVRLGDIVSHVDDPSVDDVVLARLDCDDSVPGPINPQERQNAPLERKSVDKGFKGKLNKWREQMGNREVVTQPESVKRIKKDNEPGGILERFKKKLQEGD